MTETTQQLTLNLTAEEFEAIKIVSEEFEMTMEEFAIEAILDKFEDLEEEFMSEEECADDECCDAEECSAELVQ